MICDYSEGMCPYLPVALSIRCDECMVKKAYKRGFYEQRPHGEWVYDEKSNVYRCSRCRHFPSRIITEKDDKIYTDFYRSDSYKFCPNCGSDNRKKEGEKNESDHL